MTRTKRSWRVVAGTLAGIIGVTGWLLITGWGGGSVNTATALETAVPSVPTPAFTVERSLASISPAIPLYRGANFRSDLTEQDVVAYRRDLGPDTEVYTLVTEDSFPKVWHYYVTYLAQFRGWEPTDALPDSGQQWRHLELDLNDVMTNPFIPGDSLEGSEIHVILQIVETEHSPRTVIRYIVQRPGSRMDLAERPSVPGAVFSAE